MVNEKDTRLDAIFAALSDSTRRRVLAQLETDGAATVTELADPNEMSLPGFMKHLAVLEAAGLIARSKEGRVVHCALDAAPMQEAALWMTRYERFWNAQLDALGRYLYTQEELTPWSNKPASGNNPPRSGSAGTTARRPKGSGKPGPSRRR